MLCGGVGGARAALALHENMPAENLTLLVNTGDDFEHLALPVWPDWDTVVYHLSGLQDSQRGWGRADEGTRAMEEFERLEAPTWFHLGDRDLALHVFRGWARNQGWSRARISRHVSSKLGLECRVLPLTEFGTETKIQTTDGRSLDFQDWFVREQGKPEVSKVVHQSLENNGLVEGVREAVEAADILLMAPSNPYLSLGPMLAHPDLAEAMRTLTVPKLAVSPLIGGKALKGPLDRLIDSLAKHQGQQAIAHYWANHADALLLPQEEIESVAAPPLPLIGGPTLLSTLADRRDFFHALYEAQEKLS